MSTPKKVFSPDQVTIIFDAITALGSVGFFEFLKRKTEIKEPSIDCVNYDSVSIAAFHRMLGRQEVIDEIMYFKDKNNL